jgi:hypothetical protein
MRLRFRWRSGRVDEEGAIIRGALRGEVSALETWPHASEGVNDFKCGERSVDVATGWV